jgi:topoisomerase-4 subunit A
VNVFKKNDQRTIYNAVYRDGRKGPCYIKRFNVTSMTRDKEYDLTQGTDGSRVMYFTANPNGEAEVIKVTLDPSQNIKRVFLVKDFSEIMIKGRASKGNLLTKYQVTRIGLKSHGHSTLGGRKVWFDPDVNRLNYDDHGQMLGEFYDDDQILVILNNGDYYLSNFDLNNHYEPNILRIEKYDADKIWTAVLYDADNQGYPYMKRFQMDASKKKQNWLSENPASQLLMLTDTPFPRLLVTYGGADAFRGSEEIDAEQFIAVKGYKAKGKRLTTYAIASIEELEPTRFPEPAEPTTPDADIDEEDDVDPDAGKSEQQIRDELTGQLNLFDNEDFK